MTTKTYSGRGINPETATLDDLVRLMGSQGRLIERLEAKHDYTGAKDEFDYYWKLVYLIQRRFPEHFR